MPRSLVAVVLAAGVGLGPAAVSAATFQFTVELRFEVNAVNLAEANNLDVDSVDGILSELDVIEDLRPAGPVETASGSGAVSFVSGLGGKDLAPGSGQPVLGIYRITGTGMTSPMALGSAESVLLDFTESFSFFSFGGEPNMLVDLPVELDWSIAVEASGGEWGRSRTKLKLAIFPEGQERVNSLPLKANSVFGEGRQEDSGSLSLRALAGDAGTSALRIEVKARGSAETTAPIPLPVPIPLPAAGWLLLSGLGALVLARRRRG